MPNTSINLFVYGTLMPGDGWNNSLIADYILSARPATIRGTLVDLGMIPALINGDGIVTGMLLEVDPAALIITDRLEGVPHFYNRAQVIAQCANGSEVEAWTYFYSDVERAAQCPRLLVGNKHGTPVYEWVRSHNPS